MKQYESVGILLAAGKSSRMGKNKLYLPINQDTIGSKSLETAISSNLNHTLIISKSSDQLGWLNTNQLNDNRANKWSQVTCLDSYKGQSYSIKTGVKAASKLNARFIIIMLADQPLITVKMINELIAKYKSATRKKAQVDYVVSRVNGTAIPPILFSSDFYPSLLELQGDQGARVVLRNKGKENFGLTVDYDDWSCFHDIDTEDDYKWLKEIKGL
ncbi:nucleotidyltransferase family protein [Aquibacillus rhizosphaerae]|uniref:Nucleotidyltransferase family protein n=1 Tax=Aquibacillus rhizosphaerae TaxID=3051431 RepID=A0ABT7L6H3_9BACI|nr:nucleotidyltransferase family protein [Aquibacillus sp. LR5S19]MDL4841009.1 nucleotidyltransferase family protein [Aquibacillus sp. LR5S19]